MTKWREFPNHYSTFHGPWGNITTTMVFNHSQAYTTRYQYKTKSFIYRSRYIRITDRSPADNWGGIATHAMFIGFVSASISQILVLVHYAFLKFSVPNMASDMISQETLYNIKANILCIRNAIIFLYYLLQWFDYPIDYLNTPFARLYSRSLVSQVTRVRKTTVILR